MTKWIQYGGPCRRQCDVDKKTLICSACGMYYGRVDDDKKDQMCKMFRELFDSICESKYECLYVL